MASTSAKKDGPLKVTPFRDVSDFLLDANRYSVPNFNDIKKANNRLVSNLLYYQTNYMALAAIVFALFLLGNFGKLLAGSLVVACTVAAAIADEIPPIARVKNQYPLAFWAGVGADILVVYFSYEPIKYFLLAVLVPIAISLVHAAVRTRGIKNKVNNKMEQIGASVYDNSPMLMVLSFLGQSPKDLEE